MIGLFQLAARFSPYGRRARILLPYHWNAVDRIRGLADQMHRLGDDQLRATVDALRSVVRTGHDILSDEILIPTFSLVCEAIRRTLTIEPYDEQVVAGIVLAHGAIAEMHTGEGKTITAVAPGMLRALVGKGVHVMTTNQYLAKRDFTQLKPVYEMLGASVGLLDAEASAGNKHRAYRCDVTYGPGYEFGFDYLRDQLKRLDSRFLRLGCAYRSALAAKNVVPDGLLQRGSEFAIIDEIDSVLLDEARLPLVLSRANSVDEQKPDESTAYYEAQRLTSQMVDGRDFTINERSRQVQLTGHGHALSEQRWYQIRHLALHRPWLVYVEQALKATLLLKKDVDYVVREEKVQIVDESTGRICAQRSWQDGLHQAVEVKEGLEVAGEKVSLARITRQRYFRRYKLMCGMTGTARGCEREFWELYRRGVVPIPLRKPCRRRDLPSRFFIDRASKWKALVRDVARLHKSGQPVVVGTRNIDHSEQLAELLARGGIKSQLLNGRQDQSEAQVIARAGQAAAVTIATNMAGRGTDIKLSEDAVRLGGLHVIVEEHNDDSRIDRQLVGRAARQGDPGSCQFFVSADDDVIRLYDPSLCKAMKAEGKADGEIAVDLSRRVKSIQRKIQQQNYAQRLEMLRQDRWLDELMTRVA